MIEYIKTLIENPIFSGVLGGSVGAAMLYFVKDLPKMFYAFIKRRFTVTLTIMNIYDIFDNFENWLNESKSVKKLCRNFMIRNKYSHEVDKEKEVCLTPGFGRNYFFYKKRLFIIDRGVEGKQSTTPGFIQSFTITAFCKNINFIKDFLSEVEKANKNKNNISCFLWSTNYWKNIRSRRKRFPETIFIPKEQKNKIFNDITNFINEKTKQKYIKSGIPYKRGYLFEGPPGTGKTTLAFSVASFFDKDIYILNLNDIDSDNSLADAFDKINPGSILLIEDIDAVFISKNRKQNIINENEKLKSRINLSSLLNTLDGSMSVENIIIIMTTNHPEKVDPALFRPGRVDVREYIGLMQPEQAAEMCSALLEDKENIEDFIKELDLDNLSPAELQRKILLKNAA